MLNDDAYDTENMDPASMLSPSKKIKTFDFTPTKPASKFVLHDATPKTAPVHLTMGTKRKASSDLDSSTSHNAPLSSTTTPTPISHSRGSPIRNRRVSLLKGRRASAPYKRLDPPGHPRTGAVLGVAS